MKNLLIFIIPILLTNYKSYTQSFTTIEFENYNPLWARTSVNEKIPLKKGWYELEQNYGNAALTIHKDTLYNVYNIFNDWINGYYLEAIDLKKGNLVWDFTYNGTAVKKRRYAQHPAFYGDSMKLMIFEENDSSENPFYPIWASSHAGKIIFNKNNGIILDSSFQANKDSFSKTLVIPFTPYINNFSTHLYSNNSGFIYIKNTALTNALTGDNFVNYDMYKLDKKGKQIDSFNLRIPTKYQVIYNSIVDVDDDNLFCIYYSENIIDSVNKSELAFHYMDKELTILSSGKLDQQLIPNINQRVVLSSTSKYIIVRSDSVISKTDAYFNFISLHDNKGKLIENLDLRLLYLKSNNNDIDIISSTVIYEDSKPKILFCVNSLNANTIVFYKSDGVGNYKELKRLKIKSDTKKRITLRRIEQIDKNILCHFTYEETLLQMEELPVWNAWVMINGVDLGFMTNNIDASLEKENKLTMSPNPTSDILTIEFDRVISGKLYIYNEIGNVIRSEDLYDVKEFKYNVSELLDGKYHIQFIGDNKIFNAQFIKIK